LGECILCVFIGKLSIDAQLQILHFSEKYMKSSRFSVAFGESEVNFIRRMARPLSDQLKIIARQKSAYNKKMVKKWHHRRDCLHTYSVWKTTEHPVQHFLFEKPPYHNFWKFIGPCDRDGILKM